jgi:signal transduction histidine kinase
MTETVKVLLVDDAEENLPALESALRADDREFLTASSAPETLGHLRIHDVALAVVAVRKPAVNGVALAEVARDTARSKGIPIIFIADANCGDSQILRGMDRGAMDLLCQPVEPEVLRQKANMFIDLYRQRQKLAREVRSREDVLAIVSHDLRTPLAVIHTTTSMLLNPKYNLTPEQVREQHLRIRRNVELMNRMIGDLMDIVHLRSGQLSIDPTAVLINEVLREVVSVHEAPAREKGVELSYEAGTDVMRAQADRARLMQLFQNLIGNAVKFCKPGDTINVSSRTRGSNAHIEISDSGPGISADDLPHIFDPYYSASRKHEKTGTGLGLFIAKGIVDAHGGQIRCESASGVGTTFDITLPLTD